MTVVPAALVAVSHGGRDFNGKTIALSQLDACNGITSPTPEFPNAIYHYVLPIGATGSRSSLNCFAGAVSQTQLAAATRSVCGLDALSARLQIAARASRLRIAIVSRTRPAGSRLCMAWLDRPVIS